MILTFFFISFQNVLKLDKENYNAFVFIGKCATELEQYQQAKEAYTRAIEQNKEQPLAWQVKENNNCNSNLYLD